MNFRVIFTGSAVYLIFHFFLIFVFFMTYSINLWRFLDTFSSFEPPLSPYFTDVYLRSLPLFFTTLRLIISKDLRILCYFRTWFSILYIFLVVYSSIMPLSHFIHLLLTKPANHLFKSIFIISHTGTLSGKSICFITYLKKFSIYSFPIFS